MTQVDVVEGRYDEFAEGDQCRVCGASGARPARPVRSPAYVAARVDEWSGRIALCERCANDQRRILAGDEIVRFVALAGIPIGIAVTLNFETTRAQSIAVTAVAQFVIWLVVFAMRLRLVLPALVVSGERDRIHVQLRRASAVNRSGVLAPAARRVEGGARSGLLVALVVGAAISLLSWLYANPTIAFANHSGDAQRIVMDGVSEFETAPGIQGGFIRVRMGRHRFQFPDDDSAPVLEFDVRGLREATVTLSRRDCPGAYDENGAMPRRWVRTRDGDWMLACPR